MRRKKNVEYNRFISSTSSANNTDDDEKVSSRRPVEYNRQTEIMPSIVIELEIIQP